LIHQAELAPLTIIGHSMGAGISLRYSGIYPDNVQRIVAIEGLGGSPLRSKQRVDKLPEDRMKKWIDATRALSGRVPRRYVSLEEIIERMQEANPHLRPDQARHLTIHGVNQNEDGTYSWKFDNYVRAYTPYGIDMDATRALWSRIACPALLLRGADSWANDPHEDGSAACFSNAQIVKIENAGHWVHHDQLDEVLRLVREFLASD
ncbi:MAG: alpha/beta fold hydrolase, partial [Alphaproteobacteria bacterium]